MTARGGALSARAWDITICCPRPKPRTSARQQEWHLDPERVQRTVEAFFPRGTSVTLTARTVRLSARLSSAQLGGWYTTDNMQQLLARVLDNLYFDTGLSGADGLPSPVRFEIVERTEQTSPSKGDQVT